MVIAASQSLLHDLEVSSDGSQAMDCANISYSASVIASTGATLVSNYMEGWVGPSLAVIAQDVHSQAQVLRGHVSCLSVGQGQSEGGLRLI